MALEQIYYIGQTISALVVLGSLFYLGAQIRNQTRESRHRAIQDLSDSQREWGALLAGNADLSRLWFNGIHDYTLLEPIEKMRFSMTIMGIFRVFESLFIHYMDGNLDKEAFECYETVINDIAGYPGVQTWWEDRRHWFQKPYRVRIDEKISLLKEKGTVSALYREKTLP